MGAGELPAEILTGLPSAIARAAETLAPYVRCTPLLLSESLSDAGMAVWLKLESLQFTGSFKLRGALNALLTLPESERQMGVVAASSGNHGIAVARAGALLGVPVRVYVPRGVSSVKLQGMRDHGAEVVEYGSDGLEAELAARAEASRRGSKYVSPYNDMAVVAGQGTVGSEICRQVSDLDAIVVAVGGGGLVSGVAAALRERWPAIHVVGAVPANSPVMAASVRAGRVVEMHSLPTLSDATAGGIEPGAITFSLCRQLVDTWIEVPEDEIAAGMRHLLLRERVVGEGAAGVAVAALWRAANELRGRRVAIVVCGGNVTAEVLRRVLVEREERTGQSAS